MKQTTRILSSSTTYARNAFKEQWKTNRAHVYMGAGFAILFSIGLYIFFYLLFRTVVRLEAIGDLLLDRLLSMFFLTTFTMLIFSNLVVALTTLYRSPDMEFLMTQPVERSGIFWAKFYESLFYSSWPFLYLFLPLFLAYGIARGFPLLFYPASVIAFIPFLLFAAAFGQIICLLLSGLLPARRGLWASIGAAVLFIILIAFRVVGGRETLEAYRQLNFEAILASLRVGGNAFLPSQWMTKAMLTSTTNDWIDYVFAFALLLAYSTFAMEILARLARRLYYKAWAEAQEGMGRGLAGADRPSRAVTGFRSVTNRLPGQYQGLIIKDLFTFLRDPWQWTQFAMLLGLLTVYLFNLRTTPLSQFLPFWRHMVAFFNLGATAFIFAIITTRFVYPMLSLEGSRAWLWALAPMRRKIQIWQKFTFSWLISFSFALVLLASTGYMLGETGWMLLLCAATLTMLSLGLTSLAVGLGALYPNFKTDNVARIANSVGGIITVVLSLSYVVLAISIEAVATYLFVSGKAEQWGAVGLIIAIVILAELVLHGTAIVLPLRLGIRRWSRQEF